MSSEKDPLKDIFDSIAKDYKEAFDSVKKDSKNQRNLYSIGFFEKFSKHLYDVATSINSKIRKLGIPLILTLNYGIYSKYQLYEKISNIYKINLNEVQTNLILVGATAFFYFIGFMTIKLQLNNYYMKKLRIMGFTNKEYQLPKLIKIIKNQNGEIDYHFKTVLPYDHWIKYKNELEMMFNSYIVKITNYNDNMSKIVIKTNKTRINYYEESKNTNNSIEDRIKYGFNYFNVNITLIKTIEKQYQTIVLFDCKHPKTKILALKDDLKHRTNLSHLKIQVGQNSDYQAIINKKIGIIDFNQLLSEIELNKDNNLLVGIDNNSDIHVLNIFKMTSSIVGGSAGNGKSNIVNGLLTSMYYSNLNNVVYCLIDPKKAELKKYKDIPNTFYAGQNKDIMNLLIALEEELTRREEILDTDKFIKDIEAYNYKYKKNQWCYIVVVIEEIADLMCKNKTNSNYFEEFTRIVQRLVQSGRSYGFRIFLCTQQPKASILNTTIKLSASTRFAFGTDTKMNSSLILDNDNAVGLKKGELILQHNGKDTFLKAPLVEENINQIETIITGLENLYKNADNSIIKETIQTIQKSLLSNGTTIQDKFENHTNHTNNTKNPDDANKDDIEGNKNLVGFVGSFAVETTDDLLDYYRRVAESDGKLPSVAKTSKYTNKSSTTIQKLRKELINDGKIYISGQSAYLNKDNREENIK